MSSNGLPVVVSAVVVSSATSPPAASSSVVASFLQPANECKLNYTKRLRKCLLTI